MNIGNVFDIAILAITLISGLISTRNGLVRELCGLLGLVVGVYFATKHAQEAGVLIKKTGLEFENETLLTLCGLMILLIIIWGVFILAGKLLAKMFRFSGLGIFDRFFGFLFGSGKFLIIISIIASSASSLPFLNKFLAEELSASQSWPHLIRLGKSLANIKDYAVIGELKTQVVDAATSVAADLKEK